MTSTFHGNVVAVLYFLLFQACGLMLGRTILKTENKGARLLGGSVLGSVLLQWMPVLFAFGFDFTQTAHIYAAAVTVMITVVVSLAGKRHAPDSPQQERADLRYGIIPGLLWCVFAWLVISGFEIRDGAVYSSQATYGDMSMHLGFITSIAEQQSFPPEYSILPGTRLAYPFLSDSISSSLYLWGADLRLAYMLPMLFAGAQVMGGAWLLLRAWLKGRGRALFAWVLFFLNGGFGFVYLLDGDVRENLRNMLSAFYETPTNLVEENIRWVNMIVDMLLPQRATLFGYAVLFFALYLLYRAVWDGENRLFAVVGLLGGALPMIHTHSFLALVLVSGCWLMMALCRDCDVDAAVWTKRLLVGGIVVMQLLQWVVNLLNARSSVLLLLLMLLCGVVFALVLAGLLKNYVQQFTWKGLRHWGLYLLIAAALALPQLLLWTFGQATGEHFLRGYFNWANIDDNYIWFYVKNIGVPLLLFVPGYLTGEEKHTAVAFPVLIIWLIAELVVFQPNVYDNNKLLYVAYLFMCGVAADFAAEGLAHISGAPAKAVLAAVTICLCTVSAVLTIAREWAAEYQLMGTAQVELAEYVSENTEPTDIILTDTRHNNAVAVLSGRNILCGSSSYLYYHGLDYYENQSAAEIMYETPSLYPDIFDQYGVDYILISNYERSSYTVDETAIASMFSCVYASADIRLYQVK